MPVIVVDGPDGSGKSTLVAEMARQILRDMPGGVIGGGQLIVSKWTRDRPVTVLDMREILAVAFDPDIWVIWDRSWASAAVYGTILGFDQSPLAIGAEGELMLGPLVKQYGIAVMCIGSDIEVLKMRRDPTEVLPWSVAEEREAFKIWGVNHGWHILNNEWPSEASRYIILEARQNFLKNYIVSSTLVKSERA